MLVLAPKNGMLRADGRIMRDMYLVRIKKEDQMSFPFDYFELVKTVSPDKAFLTLAEGGCALAK
jgi:branched-chain amino acid transport system substrate-binding protein